MDRVLLGRPCCGRQPEATETAVGYSVVGPIPFIRRLGLLVGDRSATAAQLLVLLILYHRYTTIRWRVLSWRDSGPRSLVNMIDEMRSFTRRAVAVLVCQIGTITPSASAVVISVTGLRPSLGNHVRLQRRPPDLRR